MGSRNTYRIDGKERDDPDVFRQVHCSPRPPSTTLPSSRPFLITRPRCFQAGLHLPVNQSTSRRRISLNPICSYMI
jgi:hypothetical protein